MACNVAPGVSENPLFVDFVQSLDAKYSIPKRSALCSTENAIMDQMKATMKSLLFSVDRLAVIVDLWSKRGLSASYIGVRASYFDHSAKKMEMLTLAVANVDQRHTAENIRRAIYGVLNQYEIPLQKVTPFLCLHSNKCLIFMTT